MAVRWWAWALAGLVLSGTFFPWTAGQLSSGPRAIVLHVNIINQTESLNGSEVEQGISMAGEVRVDYVIFVVQVLLSSSTDTAWVTNVTPEKMTFNFSGVQYFTADVFIPPKTYNRTATLTVKGNASISGVMTDTSSDTATIAVNGPGDGDGPNVPVVPPPKGDGASVLVPNLPVITTAVSAVVVASTAAIFWMWKARRLKKGGTAGRKSGRGDG